LLKELRDSEQRYGLVTEAATEGVYEWNIETNDLYVSPRLNDLFEFKAGELTSQDWNGRVHPDERESYRRALVAHFKGAEPHLQCEYRILIKSGEYRWVLDHGLAVRNQAGRAVRLVGSVSDISAQKTAEMALRESDERYALAMEAVNESVYDWDLQSGEIFYSPRLYALVGILPEQLRTTDDWLKRIHPDDLPSYKEAMRAHFKGETNRFACEYRYRGGGGSWRWARQHGLALRDATGRAYRMAGSTGDITEQRETALALEQARTRLTEAIEAVSEGFALFDAQDRLVLCNSRFREFYAEVADLIVPGTPFEQMLQATVGRDIISGTQHRGEEWIRERLQRHRHPVASHEYQLNDGRWLKISERKTAEGGIVGVYTDITELKKRETQLNELVEGLAQARDEAEQARTRLFDAIE
jgi:PAS domain S-box-containing protein